MESPSKNADLKAAKVQKRPASREQESDEYLKKRERNNIAVRKSRLKAKERIEETRQRVVVLAKENEELRNKVSLLQKELNVLRSLFANGGLTVPSEINLQITHKDNQAVVLTAVAALPNENHLNSSSDVMENALVVHVKQEP